MKCFLVVNQLNDPCFIDYDDSFAAFVISKAKEKGLVEAHLVVDELDANLVMQLFSPLVLSQWLLIDQTKEPCSSVHCPNGFCFVFHHIDDQLFMCINGDGTESEEFLYKKIQVFVSLMRFIFGPVNELMTQSHGYTKNAKGNFLRQLLQSWSEMSETEQSFLVEAVERMHVNQVMNEKCVEILKKAIKHMQSAKERTVQHAILLAKSKLLALYSNRSAHELMAKDLLSLMILSKTLYPSTDTLEDLFSKNYTGQRGATPTNENGDEEYHSAPDTPKEGISFFPSRVEEEHEQQKLIESLSACDIITQDLKNTDSGQSASESETIKSGYLSDGSQGRAPSLLEMYQEKYPNTTFNAIFSDLKVSQKVGDEETLDSDAMSGRSSNERSREENYYNEATVPPVLEKSANRVNHSNSHGLIHSKYDSMQTKGEMNRIDPEINVDNNATVSDSSAGEYSVSNSDLVNQNDRLVPQSNFVNDSPSSFCSLAVGEASRSSSVLSEGVTSYPPLSPQHLVEHLDFKSFPTSPVSEVIASTPDPAGTYKEDTIAATHPGMNPPRTVTSTPTSTNTPTPSFISSHRFRPSSTLKSAGSTTQSSTHTLSRTISSNNTSHFGGNSSVESNTVFTPQTVFLETNMCLYSPYSVDVVPVLPGMTLVLLSEVNHRNLADTLYQIIHNIQDILFGRRIKLPRARSLNVYEIISTLLAKLQSGLRRYKGRVHTLVGEICARWEKENLKQKFLEYLERDVKANMPPELESALTELFKKLKELFALMFLSPVSHSAQVFEAISQLKVLINAELVDYHGYLNVKVQRNITMTSYIDDFPGLIHFIFVDRHFHQMTAPSFNISLREGESMDATGYLKKKIWTMYQHMMKKLMDGYSTVMIKDGDFYFSYFLWFEDYMGNPLPVQESLKPVRRRCAPGTLSGSFYTDLLQLCFPHAIKGSVHCFEMFLMHLGSVHPQFISSQCKKLAHKMWEMSGEACTNISLL